MAQGWWRNSSRKGEGCCAVVACLRHGWSRPCIFGSHLEMRLRLRQPCGALLCCATNLVSWTAVGGCAMQCGTRSLFLGLQASFPFPCHGLGRCCPHRTGYVGHRIAHGACLMTHPCFGIRERCRDACSRFGSRCAVRPREEDHCGISACKRRNVDASRMLRLRGAIRSTWVGAQQTIGRR